MAFLILFALIALLVVGLFKAEYWSGRFLCGIHLLSLVFIFWGSERVQGRANAFYSFEALLIIIGLNILVAVIYLRWMSR